MTIAIMGGTGLTDVGEGEVVGECETPYGETSAPLLSVNIGGQSCIFLARHGNPHKIPPHKVNYRANLWALKEAGVRSVIAVNAVGGINPAIAVGSLVFPDQVIDYTYGREHTYSDSAEVPLEHIDFTEPFSANLRQHLIETAQKIDLPYKRCATYAVTQGPRLETAAEVDRLERDGCDIVGMTVMPEAALARECGLDYASISVVVNPAAGRSEQPITLDDIHAVLHSSIEQVKTLLTVAIPRWAS